MRLSQITVQDVLRGKNWVIVKSALGSSSDPEVREAFDFQAKDHGLFSAVATFTDKTDAAALVMKSFEDGGLHTGTYVHTRAGWVDILSEGFLRAMGKYSFEVFPFDVFVARPWKGDMELIAEGEGSLMRHVEGFEAASNRIRSNMRPEMAGRF